ncbi:MAG: LLM class F420-dependent oxidoreductase [Rhodospirillaceae bacterium]|nr:LLM class F420-dependent oxidoreductase [Rhodospirillaceae bacterium]
MAVEGLSVMKLSCLFPTRDIGTDPAKIRDFAQAAEDMGYDCIEVADHVFGAAPRGDWKPTYSEHDPFHETFTTMAFIAAVTKKIELVSGVLILPQRQTGVVAKQAAQVDILSGGRLRLGVGVGWNHVEYEALGMEWKTRGAHQAEQIEVMRRLWTEDLVTFHGKFHTLNAVNMLPVPVQRPIPIWFGGSSDAVVKRAARIGDGYMPIMSPEVAEPKLAMLREHLKAFGRDPAKFGLEGWLRMDTPDEDLWAKAAAGWKRLGAQIVMLYPMYRMPELDRQIETLRRFKAVMGG